MRKILAFLFSLAIFFTVAPFANADAITETATNFHGAGFHIDSINYSGGTTGSLSFTINPTVDYTVQSSPQRVVIAAWDDTDRVWQSTNFSTNCLQTDVCSGTYSSKPGVVPSSADYTHAIIGVHITTAPWIIWSDNTYNFSSYFGTPAYNTPAGTNVAYSENGVQLTFSQANIGGNTTITTSSSGTQPPSGFKLGQPPTYFNVSTTADFSGHDVTVCIDYSTLNIHGNGTLKIMHFEPGVGWVMLHTTSLSDTQIYATTTSFSTFAVMAVPTIPDLITKVEEMNLQQGIENSLDVKLQAAQEALSAENSGLNQTAITKLNTLINEVEAQRDNKITTSQADTLHLFATNLIKLIQGETEF